MQRLPLEALFTGNVPRMTALVGAGGKTTLMYALAERIAGMGRQVVCTTTTKLFPPENGIPLVLLAGKEDPVAAVWAALGNGRCLVAERLIPESGKLEGVTPEKLVALAGAFPKAVFLVEADGAARKPLKAPASHEPVWPFQLDCCVAVVGLDCVGMPLDEAHVHRASLACAVVAQQPGTPISPATLARLIDAPEGLFRACPKGCRRLVFGNKADIAGLEAVAEASGLSSAVWFAGSAGQGWCVLLERKSLGSAPIHDLP